jgi:hypothetical protein
MRSQSVCSYSLFPALQENGRQRLPSTASRPWVVLKVFQCFVLLKPY